MKNVGKNLQKFSAIARCLIWLSLLWTALAMPASAQQSADIEAFVRDGCVHCQHAEQFLAALQGEQPDLRLVVYNVMHEPDALKRLLSIFENNQAGPPRLPAFVVRGELIVGYIDESTTGALIRNALRSPAPQHHDADSGSCEMQSATACGGAVSSQAPVAGETIALELLGRRITLDQTGLPMFTLVMGLLDGFNPCSMWVLILMVSMLAAMGNRPRMLAVAGTFVAVEGLAYFAFMAAWLNVFLVVGLSRVSELLIAGIAIVAGAINVKDFWAFGTGISLSIPASAKPGIYQRMRRILQAESLAGAIAGAVALAVLVQVVELLCTSGFPALYTRILTLRQLQGADYYAYLLLYNLAYMLDDIIVLGIGVLTLSQQRLQEKEGRWLKLLSGLVMIGLGFYLFARGVV